MTRRDRTGEPIEDDEPEVIRRHLCIDGWTGEDDDGHPIPCPECRPHLRRRGRAWDAPPLRPGTDYS